MTDQLDVERARAYRKSLGRYDPAKVHLSHLLDAVEMLRRARMEDAQKIHALEAQLREAQGEATQPVILMPRTIAVGHSYDANGSDVGAL